MDNLEEMAKFLERCNLLRLNQEERKQTCSISSTEIETVTKDLPTNKSSRPDDFIGKFCQTFREELTTILLKLFPKNCRRGNPNVYCST